MLPSAILAQADIPVEENLDFTLEIFFPSFFDTSRACHVVPQVPETGMLPMAAKQLPNPKNRCVRRRESKPRSGVVKPGGTLEAWNTA